MTALELTGVHSGYGPTIVLRDVDLVVPQAKTVALLGANGAGKTTLLRTAAGLIKARAGSIRLQGDPVEHLPEYARVNRGLCLVPEGHAIFRRLSVRENLAMYAGGRNVKDAIERAVAVFPVLGERLSQEAGTMSGGQQQMLALSRALVVDAPVVLADELSMGLAPVVVDEIFEVVEQFRAKRRSLLIVEQFVNRALAIADYVYILHKGQVVFVGEPGQCQHEHIFEQYMGSVA